MRSIADTRRARRRGADRAAEHNAHGAAIDATDNAVERAELARRRAALA